MQWSEFKTHLAFGLKDLLVNQVLKLGQETFYAVESHILGFVGNC